MTEAVDYINFLVTQNRLEFSGNLIVDGVEISGDKEPIDDSQPNQFGFYGTPDGYGCRPNSYADEVVAKWSRSEDPFDRAAAALAPKRFLFIDSLDDLIDPKIKKLLYANHQHNFNSLRAGVRLTQLVDEKGSKIEGLHFINFGNYNFPQWDTVKNRIEKARGIPKIFDFWLRDKKRSLMRGDIADQY